MGCYSVSNVTATANYSPTLEALKFARDAEALGLSKKKRSPIRRGIATPLLINGKKPDIVPALGNVQVATKQPLRGRFSERRRETTQIPLRDCEL